MITGGLTGCARASVGGTSVTLWWHWALHSPSLAPHPHFSTRLRLNPGFIAPFLTQQRSAVSLHTLSARNRTAELQKRHYIGTKPPQISRAARTRPGPPLPLSAPLPLTAATIFLSRYAPTLPPRSGLRFPLLGVPSLPPSPRGAGLAFGGPVRSSGQPPGSAPPPSTPPRSPHKMAAGARRREAGEEGARRSGPIGEPLSASLGRPRGFPLRDWPPVSQ